MNNERQSFKPSNITTRTKRPTFCGPDVSEHYEKYGKFFDCHDTKSCHPNSRCMFTSIATNDTLKDGPDLFPRMNSLYSQSVF